MCSLRLKKTLNSFCACIRIVKFFSKRDGLFAWANFHPFWQGQSATSAGTHLARHLGIRVYIKENICHLHSGPPRVFVGPGAKYLFGGPDDVIMYSSGTRVY